MKLLTEKDDTIKAENVSLKKGKSKYLITYVKQESAFGNFVERCLDLIEYLKYPD